MSEALRVILGAKAEHVLDIRLPAYVSYKFDGWRGLWRGLEFFTRNGKAVPNRPLQALAKMTMMNKSGWDGELIVGDPTDPLCFNKTDTLLKAHHRVLPKEGVRFFVFDNAAADGPFWKRQETIHDDFPFVVKVDQHLIETYPDLEAFEENALLLGYEGIVARSPEGKYKFGRSTLNEQYLVKLKRWKKAVGTIIGYEEGQHNANEATVSELGYTRRSSHQANKIPTGMLGAFLLDWEGKQVRVGTFRGMSLHDRREIWRTRDSFLGKPQPFRYFAYGAKDLPRQPIGVWSRSDK